MKKEVEAGAIDKGWDFFGANEKGEHSRQAHAECSVHVDDMLDVAIVQLVAFRRI